MFILKYSQVAELVDDRRTQQRDMCCTRKISHAGSIPVLITKLTT